MPSLLFRAPAFVLLGAALAAGCAKKTDRLQVTGAVTLDGQPVKAGTVRFTPPAGAGAAPADGFITDGRYAVLVRPGKYKVEISSTRPKVAQRPAGPGNDEDVETVPARYNLRTELTAEVSPASLVHDFGLKSK